MWTKRPLIYTQIWNLQRDKENRENTHFQSNFFDLFGVFILYVLQNELGAFELLTRQRAQPFLRSQFLSVGADEFINFDVGIFHAQLGDIFGRQFGGRIDQVR